MRTALSIASAFCALALATPATATVQKTPEELLRAAVFRDDHPVRDTPERMEPKKPSAEETTIRLFPSKDRRDSFERRESRPFDGGNGFTIFSVTVRR